MILFSISDVLSRGSFLLPKMMTLAPFSMNFLATVIPMPVPLPVIKTTLFSNFNLTKNLSELQY